MPLSGADESVDVVVNRHIENDCALGRKVAERVGGGGRKSGRRWERGWEEVVGRVRRVNGRAEGRG